MLLEVIVCTLEDAREAARGGADRLEVVRDLARGGLTPPLKLIEDIAAAVPLPMRVMVRENDGYTTNAAERDTMREAAAAFTAAGVDGLVVGFARHGNVSIDDLLDVIAAVPAANVTFHRAFDQLADPLAAIDLLARVPSVDRILTSGGEGAAADRCARLEAYQRRAGEALTIIAGGGIDEAMVRALAPGGHLREVHVGRAARVGGTSEGAVSAAAVAQVRRWMEGAANLRRPARHE